MIQNESRIFLRDHDRADQGSARASWLVSVRPGKASWTVFAYGKACRGWNGTAGIGRSAQSHSTRIRVGRRSIHLRKRRWPRSAITKASAAKTFLVAKK